jgi:hypothetical protein
MRLAPKCAAATLVLFVVLALLSATLLLWREPRDGTGGSAAIAAFSSPAGDLLDGRLASLRTAALFQEETPIAAPAQQRASEVPRGSHPSDGLPDAAPNVLSVRRALAPVCDGPIELALDLDSSATTAKAPPAAAGAATPGSHGSAAGTATSGAPANGGRRRRRVPKILPLVLSSLVPPEEIRGAQPCGRFTRTTLRFTGLPPLEMCVWEAAKDRYISKDISRGRVWDQHVVQFMQQSVPAANGSQPTGVVVDGGANVGEFTLLGLALGHTVLSFEPIPEHVEMVARSALLNDHVRGLDPLRNRSSSFAARLRLFRAGLSDAHQRASADVPETNHGGAILRRLLSVAEPPLVVQLVTLDDVLPLSYTLHRWSPVLAPADVAEITERSQHHARRHKASTRLSAASATGSRHHARHRSAHQSTAAAEPPVLFVKLDVEGFEARALRGATHFLAQHPPAAMALELSARMFTAVDCSPAALVRALHALGYSLTGNGYGRIGPTTAEVDRYIAFLSQWNTADVFATLEQRR